MVTAHGLLPYKEEAAARGQYIVIACAFKLQ
jgi:hypothetical protein